MNRYGYFKVAAVVPEVKVADCEYNADRIIEMTQKAAERGVRVAVFPELCVTAYSCGDLFTKRLLIDKAEEVISRIAKATDKVPIVAIVGTPVAYADRLFDCAVIISQGEILGIVPKTELSVQGESNEPRWFSSS
ncbi:MAG: hypothetical protein IKL34_03790 [Alistipes sp.]|nr:hypothetical protein [Alistipes sp.]